MKKWFVILTLSLLLTGCEQKQKTDEKEESPKASVEMSVEPSESEEESTEVIESEASEETDESEKRTGDYEETEESEKIGYPWEMEELFPTSSEEEIPTELPEEQKRLVAPVPTTDLVFFECYAGPWDECLSYGIYVYISGGDMYYCYDSSGSCIFGTYYCGGQIKKYTGLSNIKRLKTFNRGTDVNPCPCIITEEGEVYWVDFNWSDGGTEIILERFEFLKDYQVEDILSYSGEWRHKVEVLLKDGSIIYLESEPWG